MFICDPCLEKQFQNMPSMFRSEGRCEICGEAHICSDITSGQLVKKLPLGMDGSPIEGPYYADLDKETGLYCAFHCETGKAHASCSTMKQAEDAAQELNDAHIAREDR